MVKKIAIRFGDNDFINTFIPLLRVLKDAMGYNGRFPKDKEGLIQIIHELSFGVYLSHQAWGDEPKEVLEHTREYLIKRITPERVLIDDEVDAYLKVTMHDNSETFILDMTQHHPYIYDL